MSYSLKFSGKNDEIWNEINSNHQVICSEDFFRRIYLFFLYFSRLIRPILRIKPHILNGIFTTIAANQNRNLEISKLVQLSNPNQLFRSVEIRFHSWLYVCFLLLSKCVGDKVISKQIWLKSYLVVDAEKIGTLFVLGYVFRVSFNC